MVQFKKVLFLYLLLFTAVRGFSQSQHEDFLNKKYRAVHWNVDQGLAFDKTYGMLKDAKGFLWIATADGLSRFDGGIFKNYYYDPLKSNSLSGSLIQGLVEDSLHNIWIGTNRGLSRYDIQADSFTNFLPSLRLNRFSSFIIPFWATKNEVFCQESDTLITSYNIHSFKKSVLIHLTTKDHVGHGYSKMYSVFDEVSGSVWMTEICDESLGGGGLLQIEISTGRRNHYNWPCLKKIPNHCHYFESMCYDRKRNALWFNSADGLMKFTLNDRQFHHDDGLSKLENVQYYDPNVGICIDQKGMIWFCSDPAGIIVYDPDRRQFRKLFPENLNVQNQVSDANGGIYCDRDGMIWSGFWLRKGIYQIIPISAPVTRYLADTVANNAWKNVIFNCAMAGKGKLWMGTDEDGVLIFEPKTSGVNYLLPHDISVLDHHTMIPILIDTTLGKAVLIVKKGTVELYEMDIGSKNHRKVVFQDSLGNAISPAAIFSCLSFQDRYMVVADYGDRTGIFRINLDSGTADVSLSFSRNETDGKFIISNGRHLLFVKRAEGLGNLTYSLYNDRWVRRSNALDSMNWDRLIYNSMDSSYWVVVPTALIHLNKDFRTIRMYGAEDGLPKNNIYTLIPDEDGNIWFNTNRYIYQLKIKTGNITALSEKDGFQFQDFRDAGPAMRYDNGDLYFPGGGTAQGFSVVTPAKYLTRPASVYFKSIEIRQFALPFSTGINNIRELSLKYFQNRITIETGIIDFYSGGKGFVRYKLEGENRDENWQYAPGYSTIRYEELPAGRYRLVLQAGNISHEYTGPQQMLSIIVNPAFWNTWWFRIMAGLLLVGGIYAGLRYRLLRKFRLRMQRAESEKQIADMRQKTAELKQQATDLEMQALRAQMNPHFIFNSLNSINRFILQNNRLQASEYLTKFSRLIRLILQNSQAVLITLESEIDSVKLYLSLESLRFDYHFDYKFTVDPDLDLSMLKVPPLIIQPYIENAIWHGLMHKEEKGHLDIELSQEKDDLFFKITDNGIGRKQAMALTSKSATRHKSMGLNITAHRIALMQSEIDHKSAVIITDLVNADGGAAGTEVIIRIPVIE